MQKIYLDNAACTPMDERVKETMLPYLSEYFGNPSSLHSFGTKSKEAVETARKSVADLISSSPDEIIFTSNGSEANNFAIKGVAFANQLKGKHIIISEIEHFSVLHSARTLVKLGFKVSYIPVDNSGIVKSDELANMITNETILVSIMHANHEIGTIEPVEEISKKLKEINKERISKALPRIYFHTDAVQTAGVIPVNVQELGVDLLSLSASSFYGPKGAAALFIKKGVKIFPLIDGGIQEGGRRAGLENVPAIAGMGRAAQLASVEMKARMEKIISLRDYFIKELFNKIKYIRLNGHPEKRLPGNVNVSIEFIEGESMLIFLNKEGVAASSGSACTSQALKASHVLLAIGLPHEICHGSILFSLSKYNTKEEIDYVLNIFPLIVERLRKMSPVYKE